MDEMINSTKSVPKASVLSTTLSEMDEWDMNKLNDAGRAAKKSKD